jgi:hypothetical protein
MTVPILSPFSTAICACAVSDNANRPGDIVNAAAGGEPFGDIGLRRGQ